jgi:hypothetical protein
VAKFWEVWHPVAASVFDPRWFQCASEPASSFYLNADPDLGSQTNADLDPDHSQTLKSQKVEFLHEKLGNRSKNKYLPTKVKKAF